MEINLEECILSNICKVCERILENRPKIVQKEILGIEITWHFFKPG